ncbi:MAG: FkbM family methyltransferase [Opitutales bacterium]
MFDFAGHCVPTGAVVWDIGANVGVFAFAAAQQAGPAGKVLAIEADPWLSSLMRRSAIASSLSPRAPVEILCAAASSAVGVQDFEITARTRSGSHLSTVPAGSPELVGPTCERHPTVTVSLDWLCQFRPVPQVVKIDVEGAELQVLRGAAELLKRHKPALHLEVHEANADEVGALLHANAYELFDFTHGWAARQPVTRATYHTLALPAQT